MSIKVEGRHVLDVQPGRDPVIIAICIAPEIAEAIGRMIEASGMTFTPRPGSPIPAIGRPLTASEARLATELGRGRETPPAASYLATPPAATVWTEGQMAAANPYAALDEWAAARDDDVTAPPERELDDECDPLPHSGVKSKTCGLCGWADDATELMDCPECSNRLTCQPS